MSFNFSVKPPHIADNQRLLYNIGEIDVQGLDMDNKTHCNKKLVSQNISISYSITRDIRNPKNIPSLNIYINKLKKRDNYRKCPIIEGFNVNYNKIKISTNPITGFISNYKSAGILFYRIVKNNYYHDVDNHDDDNHDDDNHDDEKIQLLLGKYEDDVYDIFMGKRDMEYVREDDNNIYIKREELKDTALREMYEEMGYCKSKNGTEYSMVTKPIINCIKSYIDKNKTDILTGFNGLCLYFIKIDEKFPENIREWFNNIHMEHKNFWETVEKFGYNKNDISPFITLEWVDLDYIYLGGINIRDITGDIINHDTVKNFFKSNNI